LLTLSDTIELGDIFACLPDSDKNLLKTPYRLVGLVCFYGAHYVSFYREFDSKSYFSYPKWKSYDDTHVEDFYYWKDVIKRCSETIMRPTILFYQKVKEVP
jgi:ubiquitin C-terminal hydrolase